MQLNVLILGCGKHFQKPNDGKNYTTVDILPVEGVVDVVADLNQRFPFEDGQFHHISAMHLVEHLKDLTHFMNECHRVMADGGSLYLETPLAGADPDLTHADPTHVRCYRPHSFINYYTIEGIHAFGYTDKPWAILACDTIHNGTVLRFHGMPIKRLPVA